MSHINRLILGFTTLSIFVFSQNARSEVTLLDRDGWKASLSGFIELDAFYDSTRSFVESPGSAPVQRPGTRSGESGRTQFSIRNTRLALSLLPPEAKRWKTKGYVEIDFRGFNPAPGTAGNTEATFFTSPTLRLRHAFVQADKNGWRFVAGQFWSLFGWQPHYFMLSAMVTPAPSQYYSRTPQLRAMRTTRFDDYNWLESALAITRPPQRDSSLPGIEAGLRLVLGERTAGFTGGAGVPEQRTEPMSIGVSGTFRQFAIPENTDPSRDTTKFNGAALAASALLPVLASPDGHDVSNTLSLLGSFTTGKGYGDYFPGWTGNLSSPLNSALAGTQSANVNLDAGIGDFDSAGNFQLVELTTMYAQAQYHLPARYHAWLSIGAGRLYSSNIGLLTLASNPGRTSASNAPVPYNRDDVIFGGLFHDLTPYFRAAFEYAHIRTRYEDSLVGINNRYQLSMWFHF